MEKREFKFRAWDSHLKVMKSNIQTLDSLNEYFSRDRQIVMQFIGVVDKIGVEIYEGDILKNADRDWIGVVIYDKRQAYFNVTDNYPDTLYNCEMINVTGDGWMEHEIEVIGNIYETPELCGGN